MSNGGFDKAAEEMVIVVRSVSKVLDIPATTLNKYANLNELL